MIDTKTGDLTFTDPAIRFGPALKQSAFRETDWGKATEVFVAGDGAWLSWKLTGLWRSTIPFLVVLWFNGEILVRVSLYNDELPRHSSWEDWSHEVEMQREGAKRPLQTAWRWRVAAIRSLCATERVCVRASLERRRSPRSTGRACSPWGAPTERGWSTSSRWRRITFVRSRR